MTYTLGSRLGRLRLALTSWSVAGALLAVAPWLHAQDATPSVAALRKEDAPIGAVRVFVATEEDRVFLTVAQPGKEQGIVSCYHQCSFWGLPGSYTLWATTPEREVLYETTLNVGKRTAFRVSSGHPDVQTAGMIAGIVGPIAIVGGAVLGVEHLLDHQCNESNCPAQADYPVPAVIMVSGLVATVAGWSVYGMTGPHVASLAAEPTQPIKAERPARLQLGLLPLPHSGWALGLSTQF